VSLHTSDPVPPVTPGAAHPLDFAGWASLTGPHSHFAVGQGQARRYRPDVSPFAALAPEHDVQSWTDLAAVTELGETVLLSGRPGFVRSDPPGWKVQAVIPGVQLVATEAHRSSPEPEAFVVGAADAAEAADLVARTEPGPFRAHTYQLGTYLGLRRAGRLVALAGERMHPAGYSEISAVCTDPGFRRQGLATRLIRAMADLIRQRGETPFLHTGAANTSAIDLYLALGYELRRQVDFVALTPTDLSS
jgi:ribosomal protein S18 acetylase RimI-like enzyme